MVKTWKSNFPTSLDTTTEMPNLVNKQDVSHISQILSIRDAIFSVQSVLGSDLEELGSVRKRVTVLESLVGTDNDAIHDNVSDEIHQITLKSSPAVSDEFIIEDSTDSWNKKRITISSLPIDSPLTTKGDLYGFSTVEDRLPIGTNYKILMADSSQAIGFKWEDISVIDPLTTKGDLYGYGTTSSRIPVGTDTQILSADSTELLGIKWIDIPLNNTLDQAYDQGGSGEGRIINADSGPIFIDANEENAIEIDGYLTLNDIYDPLPLVNAGLLYSKEIEGHSALIYMDDYGLSYRLDGYLFGQTDSITGSNGVTNIGDNIDAIITPTYGSSANTICQGNDSRLSDSRNPIGSASGDLTGTYPGPTINTGVVDNTKLTDMAQSTIKGRVSGSGTGDPVDLTSSQATEILNSFTDSLKGLAPASGGGTTNYLRADGSWTPPPGGGGSGSGTLHESYINGNIIWVINGEPVFIDGYGTDALEIDGYLALNEINDPSTLENSGLLYTKDDAGDTELFYLDNNGNVVQITLDGYVSGSGTSSPLTTKGDLWVYDTDNTRLPIDSDGYVLTADSSEATGIKWAEISGSGSTPHEEEFSTTGVETPGATVSEALNATPRGSGTADTPSGYDIIVFRNGVKMKYNNTPSTYNHYNYDSGNNEIDILASGSADDYEVIYRS